MANNEEKKTPENTVVHDTIALALITIIAGILLGAVYTITKEPIAEQEAKVKAEAYAAVFEGAQFVSDDEIDAKLEEYNAQLEDGQITATAMGESLSDVEVSEVMKAQKDGADAGYVVTCSGKGYGGSVVLALGIDLEGNILGIRVTSCTDETPGLGQNSSKESWNGQYVGMTVSEDGISVVKDGSGSTDGGTVNAISGATITSRAVTRAVNGALGFIASLG